MTNGISLLFKYDCNLSKKITPPSFMKFGVTTYLFYTIACLTKFLSPLHGWGGGFAMVQYLI